jgi:hypothetical protein
MLRVAIWPQDHRPRPYIEALVAAGHVIVQDHADVFLIDFDTDAAPHSTLIDQHLAQGARVVLYPHGAGHLHCWDGLHPVHPGLTAQIVIGEGGAELLRRHGYPKPTRVIGWPYGPIHPFRPARAVRRVLFAPWHPLDDYMVPDYAAANAAAFEQLLEAGVELTVRHIHGLELNGLWRVDGVRYVQGKMDGSVADLADADAVVAPESTYAYKALQHGVPTVVYGQDVHPCDVIHDPAAGGWRLRGRVVSWERYRDFIRYPFHLGDAPLPELLQAAAASREPVAEFMRLFMGEPMHPADFAGVVEELAGLTAGEAYEGRSASVVAFADEVAAAPALLAAFAAAAGPADDATLVLLAAAVDDATVAGVEGAIAAAGLDDDSLPDVVLAPVPVEPPRQRALARQAAAVLGEREPPAWLAALPRHGAAGADALRALVPGSTRRAA